MLLGAHRYPEREGKRPSQTSAGLRFERAWSFLYFAKRSVRRHTVTEGEGEGDWTLLGLALKLSRTVTTSVRSTREGATSALF